MLERVPASRLRFITSEIWCKRRYELVDESISEEGRDASEALNISGEQR
jgi:hypothetical protein